MTIDTNTMTSITDITIAEAEAEFEQDGQLFDAKATLTSLRRKHFEVV